MTDANVRTCLILGGTSAVAVAFARQAIVSGPIKFVIAGRNATRLAEVLADLKARGARADSFIVEADLGDPAQVGKISRQLLSDAGKIDNALLAYGQLGDQKVQQCDLEAARELLEVNFVSAALWCEALAAHFQETGSGRLGVIGSVAGDRGRQSNYLYGATKGGLERVCEGLAHRFAGRPQISVTLIKPGFIDTPMTDHLDKGGPLWASPETIAEVIHSAMDKGRVRVYAPWFWRWIMLIIRSLPIAIMHRTKL